MTATSWQTLEGHLKQISRCKTQSLKAFRPQDILLGTLDGRELILELLPGDSSFFLIQSLQSRTAACHSDHSPSTPQRAQNTAPPTPPESDDGLATLPGSNTRTCEATMQLHCSLGKLKLRNPETGESTSSEYVLSWMLPDESAPGQLHLVYNHTLDRLRSPELRSGQDFGHISNVPLMADGINVHMEDNKKNTEGFRYGWPSVHQTAGLIACRDNMEDRMTEHRFCEIMRDGGEAVLPINLDVDKVHANVVKLLQGTAKAEQEAQQYIHRLLAGPRNVSRYMNLLTNDSLSIHTNGFELAQMTHRVHMSYDDDVALKLHLNEDSDEYNLKWCDTDFEWTYDLDDVDDDHIVDGPVAITPCGSDKSSIVFPLGLLMRKNVSTNFVVFRILGQQERQLGIAFHFSKGNEDEEDDEEDKNEIIPPTKRSFSLPGVRLPVSTALLKYLSPGEYTLLPSTITHDGFSLQPVREANLNGRSTLVLAQAKPGAEEEGGSPKKDEDDREKEEGDRKNDADNKDCEGGGDTSTETNKSPSTDLDQKLKFLKMDGKSWNDISQETGKPKRFLKRRWNAINHASNDTGDAADESKASRYGK